MDPIRLYYHPFSRAADVVWMLEELALPYALEFVDLKKGEQKHENFRKLNPMGKLPVIQDGAVVMSERAAIGLYLADKYALGTLAPALDAPERGSYLRWSLFSPTVIEPAAMAHASSWEYRASSAGWGTWEETMTSIEAALTPGPFLLGNDFSMADAIFGGTLRYMAMFGMIEQTQRIGSYIERLEARPARQRANAINKEQAERLPPVQ